MLKLILKVIVLGSFILMSASGVIAGTENTPPASTFKGLATLENGDPIPVGSIIEAYDTSSYLCGVFTVHIEGKYGFMPVYGDDGYGGEGPDIGELITFYINGRLATTHGPDEPVFTGVVWPYVEVNLTMPAATNVSMIFMSLPDDQTAVPGATVRYSVTVQNTGDAMDFYTISAVSDHGWIINPQTELVYAESMASAIIYFDVLIPYAIQYDTDDLVNFTVTSGVDGTVSIADQVTTHVMITTDVADDETNLLPGDFKLYQNYPNPFNPTTTISFNLSGRADVELEIFNFLGQKIDVIKLENLNSGFHKVEYDAGSLASGVYLYRLKAGEKSKIRKMVLLK